MPGPHERRRIPQPFEIRNSDSHREHAQERCSKFPQPCRALEGCRCRIYRDRPTYCRQFECLLLKAVKAGRIETVAALRTIRSARRRAEKVKRLLRELGDDEEHVALSARFRRVKKRVEKGTPDLKTAELFGELTLAMHDLNVVLSAEFYMECAGRA